MYTQWNLLCLKEWVYISYRKMEGSGECHAEWNKTQKVKSYMTLYEKPKI